MEEAEKKQIKLSFPLVRVFYLSGFIFFVI